jgi:hypothetical protein
MLQIPQILGVLGAALWEAGQARGALFGEFDVAWVARLG